MDRIIYADHSATTFVKEEVLREMLPYFSNKFGNASSGYLIGRTSKSAIDKARCKVATAIGARSDEIYFTAGGSEADNMIISGIARANKYKGKHIITTKIEHLAVLNTCANLEKEGFDVTYLNVNEKGMIDSNELINSIREDTILISIMFANNEVGTIEPIEEIGNIAKEHKILFHTDAVQAIGNIDIDVIKLNIDALSLSAHKFYGPKGVGAAYIKRGIEFDNLIFGGHQEKSKRAGTENVAGIVGLGKAIELSVSNIEWYNEKLLYFRNHFINRLKNGIQGVRINGDLNNRLPGNVNLQIEGIDSQTMLLMLDMYNICASSGSACNTSSVTPSHVLTAMGLSENMANSSLRFTFGDANTINDIDYIADTLIMIIRKLRLESRNQCRCRYNN
ncbi:MAG: IscS subfamily cysteine desulfurase [Clostridia bacterium]|nr:IscS subfamily cysteine desulfurase [Clostridia bacterium]